MSKHLVVTDNLGNDIYDGKLEDFYGAAITSQYGIAGGTFTITDEVSTEQLAALIWGNRSRGPGRFDIQLLLEAILASNLDSKLTRTQLIRKFCEIAGHEISIKDAKEFVEANTPPFPV